MSLIQFVAGLSRGLGGPESCGKGSGEEQNTFSNLLQSQQRSNPEIIAKAQTEPASSLSQDNLKPRKPGQNWSPDAIAGLPVVPVATELAKVAVFSAVNNPDIAYAPSIDQTTAKGEGNADQPVPVVPAFSSPTSRTTPDSSSIAAAPALLAFPAALPPSYSSASDTATDVSGTAGSDVHAGTSALPVSGGPRSDYPEPVVVPSVAVPKTETGTDSPPIAAPATPLTSQTTPPLPDFSSPQRATDLRQIPGFAKSNMQSEPSTAALTGQPVSSQLAFDSEPGASELVTSEPLSIMEFAGLQPPDAAMPAASQATTMPMAGGAATEEITANQIGLAAVPVGVEPQTPVAPQSVGTFVNPTKLPADSPQTRSPDAELATPLPDPARPQITFVTQTTPTRAGAVATPRGTHEQENKPTTPDQRRQLSLDSEEAVSPEVVAVSPFHDIPPLTSSPAFPAAQTAASAPIGLDPGRDSGEPRLPSGQGRSTTPTLDAPTKTTTNGIPQATLPAPLTSKTQDITEEELTGVTAASLASPLPKPQQTTGDQAAVARAQEQMPNVNREPSLGGTVSSGVVVARAVEGISASEMHIGLRTQAFGTVEVHTAVRDTQLGLAVNSERGDLRSFLSPEVPSLQTALRQHDLHLETIKFIQQGSPGSGFSSNADSHSRPFSQSHPPLSGPPLDDTTEEDSALQDISLEAPIRLNVHA